MEDQKSKSELLNELELRYRAIVEDQTDLICRFKKGQILTFVNKAYCDYFGKTSDELTGQCFLLMLPENEKKTISENIEMLNSKNPVWVHEQRVLLDNGRTVWQQWVNRAIFNENGNIIEYQAVGRDITKLKKVQEKLKESETRFRTLSEATFEAINIHENKVIYDANQKFVELFGYSMEEIKHINGLQLFAPECRETVDGYVAAGYIGVYQTVGLRKDGTKFPIKVRAREMQIQGRTFRVVAITDLTLQKQIESERQDYMEKVSIAQRHAYIGSMGAIIAHQLNQPLTKINILLDRALEDAEDGSCRPAVIKGIKESLKYANDAAAIIRSFRQSFKNDSIENVDRVIINDVTERIVSLLSKKANKAKMRISVNGLADIPEYEISETALEQIFLIIIENAIEAADGIRQHKLDITGKYTDGNIELRFSDDCCGIAPENIDKIFEPFFSTKTEDKGMGLGLDIVQQLLMRCGGQARVESKLGEGTDFYITLPPGDTAGGIV